jgi:hypothetical protein
MYVDPIDHAAASRKANPPTASSLGLINDVPMMMR